MKRSQRHRSVPHSALRSNSYATSNAASKNKIIEILEKRDLRHCNEKIVASL
jgi:hypothetical protein